MHLCLTLLQYSNNVFMSSAFLSVDPLELTLSSSESKVAQDRQDPELDDFYVEFDLALSLGSRERAGNTTPLQFSAR